MSKMILEVSEDNPDNTIDLTQHQDKFIIRIVNVKVTYDEVSKEKTVIKYNSTL